MDSAADGLLALATLASGPVANQSVTAQDDDRSSSLSDLDDGLDDIEVEVVGPGPVVDDEEDSEAETERLEISPDKHTRKKLQISPSKLVQTTTVDGRPEIEELTDSEASSPMTPVGESPTDELSEAEDIEEPGAVGTLIPQLTNKRKRLSDVMDMEEEVRARKRRTQSVETDDDKSDFSDAPDLPSRMPSAEPEKQEEAQIVEPIETVEPEQEIAEAASDDSKTKRTQNTRTRSRRGKAQPEEEVDAEENDEHLVSDVEADDAEAQVKSEEEQAKRAAAMEALTTLEKHFATLRDKLYDEKIHQLNHELAQLTEEKPSHPELMKQFDCIHKHRDQKFDVEQRLLVFKIGALKRKSIAERAAHLSGYFQTVRDVREKYMERLSEHFYKIQREKFKSTQITPVYTIPFPVKKLDQVVQQTAYNKEVSILSGIARYVGFPAAPELPSAVPADLESDMIRMGISPTRIRTNHRTFTHHAPASRVVSANIATAAAASEQQFLEQTPWANPNHPIHKLGRPLLPPDAATPAPNSKMADFTPVTQASTSASTIPEYPSAQHSSIFDTPRDAATVQHSQKSEQVADYMNSLTGKSNGHSTIPLSPRSESISPTTTRRTIDSLLNAHQDQQQQQNKAHTATSRDQPSTNARANTNSDTNIQTNANPHALASTAIIEPNHPTTFPQFSSPLQARAALLADLNRTASVQPQSQSHVYPHVHSQPGQEGVRKSSQSPFPSTSISISISTQNQTQDSRNGNGSGNGNGNPAVTGPGMARFGFK